MSAVTPSETHRRSTRPRAIDWRWLGPVALFVTVVAVELAILLVAGQPTGGLGDFANFP
jgi:hypothetical protein